MCISSKLISSLQLATGLNLPVIGGIATASVGPTKILGQLANVWVNIRGCNMATKVIYQMYCHAVRLL